MMFQITSLSNWNPFKLDALGLITLLGAEEVGFAFGRLVNNHLSMFLPTVGAYVFAADSHATPIQGFQVYNITDSIYTTDIPGWFSRWLLSQNVKTNATKYEVAYIKSPRRSISLLSLGGIALGTLVHASIIIFSVLIWDWWGFANGVLMVLSTLSRYIIIEQTKRVLDDNAKEGEEWSDGDELQKTIWILRSGEAVTITAPKGLLIKCLLTNPIPKTRIPFFARGIAWISFGGFAITLGMSTLFIQILVVVVVLACTCMAVFHVGDDDQIIGTRLEFTRRENPKDSDRRAELYSKLALSSEEEERLLHWSLFPLRSNKKWWACYQYCKDRGPGGFEIWTQVLENYSRYGRPDTPVT